MIDLQLRETHLRLSEEQETCAASSAWTVAARSGPMSVCVARELRIASGRADTIASASSTDWRRDVSAARVSLSLCSWRSVCDSCGREKVSDLLGGGGRVLVRSCALRITFSTSNSVTRARSTSVYCGDSRGGPSALRATSRSTSSQRLTPKRVVEPSLRRIRSKSSCFIRRTISCASCRDGVRDSEAAFLPSDGGARMGERSASSHFANSRLSPGGVALRADAAIDSTKRVQ
jgi:hypothetical protein